VHKTALPTIGAICDTISYDRAKVVMFCSRLDTMIGNGIDVEISLKREYRLSSQP